MYTVSYLPAFQTTDAIYGRRDGVKMYNTLIFTPPPLPQMSYAGGLTFGINTLRKLPSSEVRMKLRLRGFVHHLAVCPKLSVN